MRVSVFCFLVMSVMCSAESDEFRSKMVIDTFTDCVSLEDGLPCGWYGTQRDVGMYSLRSDRGNHFVKVRTEGGNTTIGCKFTENASEYPFLAWRWRVHKLPSGAREDVKKLSDSGAGVYVIFRGTLRLNRMIKYVWSSTLPVGTVTESPFNGRAKIKVLRSGGEKMGCWIGEKVNVMRDYEEIFGSKPPQIEAIAIMSDADNTQSSVEADYDDFLISRD